MRKLLIAGIGNVLLGDDGVGPFVIKVLESQYDFAESVELADLGTPGFDLLVHLSGADAVILVDSAMFGGKAGDIRLFHREDILRIPAVARIDPHSPALRESLSQLELMGAMPRELLLIGVQGLIFEPGSPLSTPVRHCIPAVIDAVRRELYRLDIWCEPKATAGIPAVWWDPIFEQRKERECACYASD
jgi:hydrogenase maturation protease